jgi:hypothetical protein
VVLAIDEPVANEERSALDRLAEIGGEVAPFVEGVLVANVLAGAGDGEFVRICDGEAHAVERRLRVRAVR